MSLQKIFYVAGREFSTTVMTRGFMIGLLLMPAVVAMAFVVVPRLMNQRVRPIEGVVAVSDPTGQIADRLRQAIEPDAVGQRRAITTSEQLPQAVRNAGFANLSTAQVRERATAEAPVLHLVEAPADAEARRQWLLGASPSARRLAVVVVHGDAITTAGAGASYDLYVAPRLDSRVENSLYDGMREALITARAEAAGLDRSRFDDINHVARARSLTVTTSGDRPADADFLNQALPFIFIALMFVGVMVGGQGLMTSTIEEKSSRVIEVLLSAVSPTELMAGKILGQLAVSALTLGLYVGLGVAVLWSMAMIGIVSPMIVVYLVIFYVLAYMTLGSLMAAIGAAVNEMREAQSLMMPVTLTIMIPWVLAGPILRNPSSTLATVLSLLPPMSTFAMLIRVTSTTPPPAWQIVLSIALSAGAVAASIWFAAKVFRIGLLMFGKPPDLATLVKWARMA